MKSILNTKHALSIKGWPNDPVAKVIVPIVEGQVRSLINDHPEYFAVPKGGTVETIALSLVKRIANDLLCGPNAARLAEALATSLEQSVAQAGVVKAEPAPADAVVKAVSAESAELTPVTIISAEDWDVLTEALERPPEPKPALRELLKRKSIWEKKE